MIKLTYLHGLVFQMRGTLAFHITSLYYIYYDLADSKNGL